MKTKRKEKLELNAEEKKITILRNIRKVTYVVVALLLVVEVSTIFLTSNRNLSSTLATADDKDGDGLTADTTPADTNDNVWDVGDRDLALFASLAYQNINYTENGVKKVCKSYTDGNGACQPVSVAKYLFNSANYDGFAGLKLSSDMDPVYAETNIDYLLYNMANVSEVYNQWDIVGYQNTETSKLSSNISKLFTKTDKEVAMFTAVTFQNKNNIVIAYRGTDFDDIFEWLQDVKYPIGYLGQEQYAKDYAINVAKYYQNELGGVYQNPNNSKDPANGQPYKIYITGHSLGAYLSQVGGAALIQEGLSNNLEEVLYFNGMGLNYLNKLISNSDESDQTKMINTLRTWYSEGHKLYGYYTQGDPVSSMGTHCGARKGFAPSPIAIAHHKGEMAIIQKKLIKTDLTSSFTGQAFNLFVAGAQTLNILNNDNQLRETYNNNNFTSLMDFVWTTHETDSFLYNLSQGTRTWKNYYNVQAPKCEIVLADKVKLNKTTTMKIVCKSSLPIDTDGEGSKITTKDLKVNTIIKRIKLGTNIKTLEPKQLSDGTWEYTWNVTVKGYLLGSSSVSLNKNAITIGNVGNPVADSNTIKVTLR